MTAVFFLVGMAHSLTVYAEDFTTYLPSPDGDYRELTSTDDTDLATDGAATSIVNIGNVTSWPLRPTPLPDNDAILNMYINPDTSLNLKAKGLLIPRMTPPLPTPASSDVGLLIYNDGANQHKFQYWTGSLWTDLGYSAPETHYWYGVLGNGTEDESPSSTNYDLRNSNESDLDNNPNTHTYDGHVGIGTPLGMIPPAKLTVWTDDNSADGETSSLFVNGNMGNTYSGAGTRMQWVGPEASFSAGHVTGTQWNSIGYRSIAVGRDTLPNGRYTGVFGSGSRAWGDSSVAIGYGTSTNGTATGYGANANARIATALGGDWAYSGALSSFTLGHHIQATGAGSMVIGSGRTPTPHLLNSKDYTLMIGVNVTSPLVYVEHEKVGIGTIAPEYALDVVGQLRTKNICFLSDQRLKTNIIPVEPSLMKLLKIHGISYLWNRSAEKIGFTNSKNGELGISAQETEKVFPEIVANDRDYKSVSYSELNVFLLQAIKELNEKNERLSNRLDRLDQNTHLRRGSYEN